MARTKKDPSETQRSIERPLAGLAGLRGFDDGEAILGTPRVDPPGFMSSRVSVRKAYKMLIGGAFVRSESGLCTQVPETASGGFAGGSASMENVPRASRKDSRDAVVAARGAQGGWAGRTAYNRGQILYRLAEMLDARQAELSRSLERGGLGAKDARAEVEATIDRAIAYAGWADKFQSLFSSLNPTGGPHFTFTVPEPMGVVAVAAPPRPALLGLAGAILPVIVAGNTCVVLASEQDPRTAITFCEALATSDLPGGVVNILTGKVAEVLPHLAKHMEVAALDLHGVDPALVKSVSEAAAVNVKRVRARALDAHAWFDAAAAESPRWIERFVEMKTIWHPSGM
jgi:acyl-CoA reductase-like NAD-dependent aldehyde dehydrogenase